jgi:predicted dehydrogenase
MTVSRRDFLSTSAAAASAAALGLGWASRTFAQDTADIRVAVIGFNGQGGSHIQHLGKNIVALCDVDETVLNRRADQMARNGRKRPETFTDFRKLLERQDIDAITTATPNHIHAWVTVLAAQAGKDVYCEKPASHDIWEGRQMIAAAKTHKRIIQIGTQSRGSSSLHEAVQWVRDGNLGKILYAIGTCYKPRQAVAKRETPLEIPSTLNYDLWCGPAEKQDLYRNGVHYDWHWDWNTGNGDMGNQGIHEMDRARWFLGESAVAPRVLSIGGRLGYSDAGNTPNTQTVFFDYPNAPLIFETRGLPTSKAGQANWGRNMDRFRGSSVGVIIQCEKGYVLTPNYTSATAFDKDGTQIKQWRVQYNELQAHLNNWLAAVASRDASKLNQPIESGHVSSALCHLGGISHQLGKPARAGAIAEQIKGNDLFSMSFDRMAAHLRANGVDIDGGSGAITLGESLEVDPKTETFVKNDAANALRARAKQRDGFAVPDIEAGMVTTTAAG